MPVSTEHVEELLELVWTAGEDGLAPVERNRLPKRLVCFEPHPIEPDGDEEQGTIDLMLAKGFLSAEGLKISLTAEGWLKAQEVVRRHRLSEVLLVGVFEVSDSSVEVTACKAEHILNDEVTDAVCTFLGHPPSCPHGRPIPKGACCRAAIPAAEPVIIPLSQLKIGEGARVAFIHTRRHEYLNRLYAVGLVPGATLRLRRLLPALLVQIGETELALDSHAGGEIFVRRRLKAAK